MTEKTSEEFHFSNKAISELMQSVTSRGAKFRFRAKGFSMSPFVKNDDAVTITSYCSRAPGLGDVVAINHAETGRLLVHRIVGRKEGLYLIKGDGVAQADGLVARSSILGRVVRIERDNKGIFLGLGPERFLIAFFMRYGMFHALRLVWRFMHRNEKGSGNS